MPKPEVTSTQRNLVGESLPDFMLACGQQDPRHLAPVVDAFERAINGRERLRCVVAAPRQHGKSTLVLHAIPWSLLNFPAIHVAYCTYGQQFSARQSRDMRKTAVAAGVKLSDDFNTIAEWRTTQGGGVLATSIDGPLTGHKVKLGVIDDPFKGRAEAESPEQRELAWAWLKGDLMPCMTPNGSIFLIASRYHEDDLSGRALRHLKWDHIRLPAIADSDDDLLGRAIGEPLCPWGPDPDEPRDLAFLERTRDELGPYDWESLMQGNPRPASGSVFTGARLYELGDRPKIVRWAIGMDAAFSTGTRGDRTAIVVLGLGEDGIVYVINVQSWRAGVIECESLLAGTFAAYAGVPRAAYVSGPEVGSYRALARNGIHVAMLPAKLSKYMRAQRTAKRWNVGGVRVLRGAPWADELVRKCCAFTGEEGGADDEVDALVAGHDLLMGATATGSPPGGRFTHGRRVM